MDQVLEFSGSVGVPKVVRVRLRYELLARERLRKLTDECEMGAESKPAQPLDIIASALNVGNSVTPFPIVDNSARASVRSVYLASRWTMVD